MFKWLSQPLEKRKQWLSQPLGKRKQRLSQPLGKRKKNTRQLWDREFNIVDKGLDEEQVSAFINDLIEKHKSSQESAATSLQSIIQKAVTDAEQIADSIKRRAQAEAEAEGVSIIDQAKQETEEIKRRTKIDAQKEIEDILLVAHRKAGITEVEAKQKALLFLLKAREEIGEEIKRDYKRAHARLYSAIHTLMNEGQNIETELRGKRVNLWESKDFELKEYETALLSTGGETAPPIKETPAPIESKIEADMASREKVEAPPSLKRRLWKRLNRPLRPQEEALEKKIGPPAQPQKVVQQEKVEAPTQPQAEVMEKIEPPPQPQAEATVAELVESTAPEPVGQPLAEERLDTETGVTPLKQGDQTLYTGEVELDIATPIDLKMVSKLYNYLQTIPEVKILHTRGFRDRGTTITIVLDKPIPLNNVISKIEGIEATPELPEKDGLVKGKSSSLLGKQKGGTRRIKLTLKEE